MRIDPVRSTQIASINAYRAPASQPARSSDSSGRAADVQLSDSAAQARRAQAAAASAADTRADRVAQIKAQVQDGSYQVNTTELAEKLLTVL
jgi:negative regulator of flagellin synthesis FlgM